jgi:hypothetical protein
MVRNLPLFVIPAEAGIQLILVPCFHRDKSGFPLEFTPHLDAGRE